jgi:hypothetical protein
MGLPTMEHMATLPVAPGPEQLTLPNLDATPVDARQTGFNFDEPAPRALADAEAGPARASGDETAEAPRTGDADKGEGPVARDAAEEPDRVRIRLDEPDAEARARDEAVELEAAELESAALEEVRSTPRTLSALRVATLPGSGVGGGPGGGGSGGATAAVSDEERQRERALRRDFSRGVGAAAAAALGPLGLLGGTAVGAAVGEAVLADSALAGGFARARMEPIVEHPNPAYPQPPGDPQEVVDLQNRLLEILEARAAAEEAERSSRADAKRHEENAEPLALLEARTGESITATEAHSAAVESREQANAQQTQQEESVGEAISSYSERAAGLAIITGPLEAMQAFSYLGNWLPDDPAVLQGAKRGLRSLNRDSTNFLNSLNGVDSAMAQQNTAQPERTGIIDANAGRLSTTASEADASAQSLKQTQQGTVEVSARNDARAAESRSVESSSASTGTQLDEHADAIESRIQSLSEQWQSWAQAHRAAREAAVSSTRERLEGEGYTVTEASSA